VPKFLNPETMPKPASNYVQAVEMDPRRGWSSRGRSASPLGEVSQGYQAQAEQAWRNALAGLEAAA
jgi:2-iminobutanoate/2-iminopropanoate deaminase